MSLHQDVSGKENEQLNSIKHSKIGDLDNVSKKPQDVNGNENGPINSTKHSQTRNLDNDSNKLQKSQVHPSLKENWNANNNLSKAMKEKHISAKTKSLKATIQPQLEIEPSFSFFNDNNIPMEHHNLSVMDQK